MSDFDLMKIRLVISKYKKTLFRLMAAMRGVFSIKISLGFGFYRVEEGVVKICNKLDVPAGLRNFKRFF